MPLDFYSLLAGLLVLVLAGSVLASRVAWLRRSTRDAPAREGRTGWRALQSAGASRVRARNRAEMRGIQQTDGEEMLGKAHRKRLARQSSPGPWR